MATDVLAMVLAGGEGKRLMPLTADRAKPAVPFGGHYRIVDFALSNLANAGYLKIVVLTQYKSHSLDLHITRTWRLSTLLGSYVTPVPAQMRRGPRWFAGSADAIYQNLNLVGDENPDYLIVFGADHIYRMDVSQMVEFHRQAGADVTVAARPVPLADASQFGVLAVDGTRKIADDRQNPIAPSARVSCNCFFRILTRPRYQSDKRALTQSRAQRRATDAPGRPGKQNDVAFE